MRSTHSKHGLRLGVRVLLQSSLYSEEAATGYSSECWSQGQNFRRLPHIDQFKFCLWFSAAQARHYQGQVRLAIYKYLKLCVTKLVLSAQGTFQVGLHLFLTTTWDDLCRWLEADLRSLRSFFPLSLWLSLVFHRLRKVVHKMLNSSSLIWPKVGRSHPGVSQLAPFGHRAQISTYPIGRETGPLACSA